MLKGTALCHPSSMFILYVKVYFSYQVNFSFIHLYFLAYMKVFSHKIPPDIFLLDSKFQRINGHTDLKVKIVI